jgi:hypothetical protein
LFTVTVAELISGIGAAKFGEMGAGVVIEMGAGVVLEMGAPAGEEPGEFIY